MKKLSQINEGMFSGIIRRSNSDLKKKEEGKKVMTCLGLETFLQDTECDYDKLIEELLPDYCSYSCVILNSQIANYSPEIISNIKNLKEPYKYLIFDGKHGSSLYAEFDSYNHIINFDDEGFQNDFSEHDYISICRCVAEKIKEVGEYIYKTNSDVYLMDGFSSARYDKIYVLTLVDESTTFDWICRNEANEDEGDITSIHKDLINEFPELDNEDIIVWSYGKNGYNIGISITVDNLNNFQKYYEYTQEWFK